MGSGNRPKIRIGLLIDSYNLPLWIHRIIHNVTSSDIAEISSVFMNSHPVEKSGTSYSSKFIKKVDHAIFRSYKEWDNLTAGIENDPLKLQDAGHLLKKYPSIEIQPIRSRTSFHYSESDIKKITDLELDVILYFSFRIIRGDILKSATHGIWSYHHDDNRFYRGGPPGFWEVMLDDPVTGSSLQILTSKLDAGRVIYKSYASTSRYSVARNRANYFWKSSHFVMRKLRDLSENGSEALEAVDNTITQKQVGPIYKVPGNLKMISMLQSLSTRTFERRVSDLLFPGSWAIAFKTGTEVPFEKPSDDFKIISPSKGHFWADPFPTCLKDRYFVFVEDFVSSSKKAHISMIEINRDGSWKKPVPVIEKDYHISYPFIFRDRDEWFMVPETSENKTIDLYRCTSFPNEWKLECTLLSGIRALDPTLIKINDKWWMFANVPEEYSSDNDELHLFYADKIEGPWIPHKRNPIKSDVRSARPAGKLFTHNGNLYRPAQDCSLFYGWAISINRIRKITTDEYEETEVSKIYPSWNKRIVRTHTINYTDGLTVVDCFLKRSRFGM